MSSSRIIEPIAITKTGSRDLWISDGTASGTEFVTTYQYRHKLNRPFQAVDQTIIGDTLYFSGTEPESPGGFLANNGQRYDGVSVSSLNAAAQKVTPVGEKIFFVAPHPEPGKGTELWATLDDFQTSQMLTDTGEGRYTGVLAIDPLLDSPLVELGGSLYFTAAGREEELNELWTSDGTLSRLTELK